MSKIESELNNRKVMLSADGISERYECIISIKETKCLKDIVNLYTYKTYSYLLFNESNEKQQEFLDVIKYLHIHDYTFKDILENPDKEVYVCGHCMN